MLLALARCYISVTMTVLESIELAFADVPYPGDDKIAEHKDCPECDDIREHFRGSTWRGHTVDELQQYQSALSLFTPEALLYFLPAFMLVSLGEWDEAGDIPFFIMCIFLPSGTWNQMMITDIIGKSDLRYSRNDNVKQLRLF